MNALRADNELAMPGAASALVNLVLFQIGWFACVLGAARGWPWAGTAVAAAVVAWHLWRALRPAEELKLIAIALLTGVMWDSLLIKLGCIAFTSGALIEGVAPIWILALWAIFATTLNASLRWLQDRLLVAALVGAAAGPLSYWAGASLGAVTLVEPAPALAFLCIGWAALTPLLLALARRYDGMRPAS